MIYNYPYKEILDWQNQPLPDTITIKDHLGGFNQDGTNYILDHLNAIAAKQNKKLSLVYHIILDYTVKKNYPNLDIIFDADFQNKANLMELHNYNIHPEIDFKNFLCSFNGSPHVSRKLLASIIKKFKWFDPEYCSKNFSFNSDIVDGHLSDYLSNIEHRIYKKFFDNDDEFCQTKYSFGHIRFNHRNNIYNLESKLTESFLHIVSETMATSYYPFVTEKFLYSVVTRGLFLSYAQPAWHSHIEKYYGFKLYTNLFDYRFDSIQNPVERLVELMSMISKFDKLTPAEWYDLYLLEQDTIEYNYNHYFSGEYLNCLSRYE